VEVGTGLEGYVKEKEAGLYMFTASTWKMCRMYAHYIPRSIFYYSLSVTQPRHPRWQARS
jgi:hypothetical protein